MKAIRRLTTSLAMLTAITLTNQATIQAEDLSYTDLVSRITALETELQNTTNVQLASCDGEASCGIANSCKSSCCPCPAWYVGYELTYLRPIISEFAFGPFDDEYGAGHRLVAGYDGGSGMGARVRYWFYNHGHDIIPAAAGSVGIDMDVLDLEFTLDEQLRNWDLMLSGGFRYGRVGITTPSFIGVSAYFEGVGPTASLEAVRHFGDRGLYLIGNGRTSLLFGDIDNGTTTYEDDIVTVLESQLGVGYSRELNGATLTLRTVWETQFWLNDSFFSSTDLGFAGPTSSIELRY